MLTSSALGEHLAICCNIHKHRLSFRHSCAFHSMINVLLLIHVFVFGPITAQPTELGKEEQ